MPTFDTPEPISVTLELGIADIRVAATDRRDTVVDVQPSDPSKKSDVAAAQQTRVEYANGAPARQVAEGVAAVVALGPRRNGIDRRAHRVAVGLRRARGRRRRGSSLHGTDRRVPLPDRASETSCSSAPVRWSSRPAPAPSRSRRSPARPR